MILRLLAVRLAMLVVTLVVASLVIYGALYLAPGNPATLLAGGHATRGELALISRQMQLNQPFVVRYWHWLDGLLHGNLGESYVYREPVVTLLAPRVLNTVFLVLYASLIIIVGGLALGLVAALFKRLGVAVTVLTSVGLATPSFVAAIILITLLAVDWKVFPVFGGGSGVVDRIDHLTLPAVALALSWVAYTSQLTKTAIQAELDKEHVETARGRGIKRRHIVTRHLLRNAMIPISTVSGITIAGLIAGDVVVEQAFGVNGLGSFLVAAALDKDFASVQAVALILVTTFVVVNGVVDLWSLFLDPRLRARGA
jgi:peptide/nickel transport system permease protein